MDKEVVVHIHNEILVIKRNTFKSVLMRWMNLEPIIQSEVSEKEKNKNHILMYTRIYMESKKMVLMNAGPQWRCRWREQTCRHGRGRRGWDE